MPNEDIMHAALEGDRLVDSADNFEFIDEDLPNDEEMD